MDSENIIKWILHIIYIYSSNMNKIGMSVIRSIFSKNYDRNFRSRPTNNGYVDVCIGSAVTIFGFGSFISMFFYTDNDMPTLEIDGESK